MKYPQRDPFYSHRFCRLLTKSAAAQELGPEVCWMLTVIASQEDAKRYRGAVTYWNEQLMPLCGLGGRRRLVLARQKAVDAGWLHYEPGNKGKAGLYWTLIPERYADLEDAPMDESSDDFCRREVANQRESSRSEMEQEHEQEAICRSEMEQQTCAMRNGKRALCGTANVRLSSLTLDPIPNPPQAPQGGSGRPTPEEFVERWNSYFRDKPKIPQVRDLTAKRKKQLAARLKEPGWFEAFKVAITQMPLGETDGKTWQPNFDWLIRNDTNARRLAEGEFRWRNADDPAREKRQANLRRIEAEKREERLAEEKRKRRWETKSSRSAIESILHPRDGDGGEQHGSSLLAGLDNDDSSANGAGERRTSSGGGSDANT